MRCSLEGLAFAITVTLVASCGSTPSQSGDPAPKEQAPPYERSFPWRIGTWNLHEFPSDVHSADEVARFIDERDISMIALQEIVDAAGVEALAQDLTGYRFVLAPTGGDLLRIAIGYRALDYDLLETLPWFAGDSSFEREPVALRFRVKGVDMEVVVVAVHLKAGLTPTDIARREEQVQRLAEVLHAEAAPGSRIVLLGDFNTSKSDADWQAIMAPLLAADSGFEILSGWLSEPEDASYLPAQIVLDHVLVSDALHQAVVGYGAHTHFFTPQSGTYAEVLGDHRPVVGELNFHHPCSQTTSCPLGECVEQRCIVLFSTPPGESCAADELCESSMCLSSGVCSESR